MRLSVKDRLNLDVSTQFPQILIFQWCSFAALHCMYGSKIGTISHLNSLQPYKHLVNPSYISGNKQIEICLMLWIFQNAYFISSDAMQTFQEIIFKSSHSTLNNIKTKNLIQKLVKDLIRWFTEEEIQKVKSTWKEASRYMLSGQFKLQQHLNAIVHVLE